MKRRLIVPALAVVLSSCNFTTYKTIGEAATETFHQRVDRGDYDAITDSASYLMYRVIDPDDLREALITVHEMVGPCGPATHTGWRVSETQRGSFVTISATRSCEAQDLEEDFVWEIAGSQANLAGYTYRPVAKAGRAAGSGSSTI